MTEQPQDRDTVQPSGTWQPPTDEELDQMAVVTPADIADANADLRRRRADIARKILKREERRNARTR